MHGMRFLGFLPGSGVNLRQASGLLLPKIRTLKGFEESGDC